MHITGHVLSRSSAADEVNMTYSATGFVAFPLITLSRSCFLSQCSSQLYTKRLDT